MCRRKDLYCCCLFCFGLGILFGKCVESWVFCGCIAIACFCMPLTKRR